MKPNFSREIDDAERLLGEELRDAFFATCGSPLDAPETVDFRRRVADTHADAVTWLDGLSLSFYPTDRFRDVRFMDADKIDEDVRHLFTRPAPKMRHLAAVFVDPEEFSFRTFENILPLDAWFDGPLELSLKKNDRLGAAKKAIGFSLSLAGSDDALARLTALDELGLYVAPTNAGSRGGRRFIFHASALAEALTRAVRDALPASWLKGFRHVNPVFRCNRFEPDDPPFRAHFDTPYYDANQHHISKHTLLIYLTGGEGESVLRIGDDVDLHRIDDMTCVVFPQSIRHDGAAYARGRKVFLRTELIFEDKSVEHDERIAEMFAKACYLTGESVLAPEIAEHVHQLYDRAAAAHWQGITRATSAPEAEPIVAKTYRGMDFVTNGYDYYFRRDHASLQDCAALATLDALNCQVGRTSFRKLCTSRVVTTDVAAASWAANHLAEVASPEEALFEALDCALLFPPPEAEENKGLCCSFHHPDLFEPRRDPETIDAYCQAQAFARRRIDSAPIHVLGQEIFVDPDRFVVEGNRIHVLGSDKLNRVNFAACGNDEYSAIRVLDVEAPVEAQHLLVPPILWSLEGELVHLRLDFFRNSWMVKQRQVSAPVPSIGVDWFTDENRWADAFESARERDGDATWPKLDDDATAEWFEDQY